MQKFTSIVFLAIIAVIAALTGCGETTSNQPIASPHDPANIKFKDSVETNVEIPTEVGALEFVDTNGNRITLSDFEGKKNVVLVFTQGFNGALCPFCQTQTSRLVANYEKFSELDSEILVVYPGPKDHLDEFMTVAAKEAKSQTGKVPFPIVLDEDFVATTFFDIKSLHAHPSTFIIGKNLKVQLAYVGQDKTADRPSVKAMLEKIETLNR
ncbi:MAG: peroxiredoxin family protein [Mariniblastus sp.]